MADFRLCSTCQSRSQAGLCHCTQQPMSDRLEPTIARLRYSLGGDRPSQTTHHTGSRTRLHWPRLDNKTQKGGISRLPPPRLALQPVHQWYVHPGPLVLGATPLNSSTPMADRDRTVSRRSEPNSRTTLIGEQPNPWDLLQPQDVMSRHRGAKHPRRYELLEGISLLSPAYLLSVERWPFHSEPPDHYDRLSTLLDLSVSQSGRLMPLHSTIDF